MMLINIPNKIPKGKIVAKNINNKFMFKIALYKPYIFMSLY